MNWAFSSIGGASVSVRDGLGCLKTLYPELSKLFLLQYAENPALIE
jgi:hypothetical protein